MQLLPGIYSGNHEVVFLDIFNAVCFIFSSSGQEILNPQGKIQKNLKLLFIEYCDGMTTKEQSQMQFLIEDFSGEHSQFRETLDEQVNCRLNRKTFTYRYVFYDKNLKVK